MMSAFFHGSRPTNPVSTYAAQNSSSATRGRRRTALWATMAGVGRFTRGSVSHGRGRPRQQKRQPEAAFPGVDGSSYLAAVLLPYFLKKLSTRPPMSLTDFWVRV